MMRAMLPRALLAAALVFPLQRVAAEIPVPRLAARVTDLTGTLTPEQRAAVEAKLATFEARKGSQVAVLIVPTTQPETIEQYSIRVADEWKLGRKGVDDGALLVIAKNDRKLRIEVGRGLEGAIPDAIAKRIVSDIIAPRFKEGDFYGGIVAGTDRILRTIEGEPLPPPKPRAQTGRGEDEFSWLIAGFILVIVVGGVLRAIFGRFLGSGIVGFGGGLIGYLLFGAAAAVAIAIIAFLLSLFSGAAPGRGSGWSTGPGWGSGGGFGGGGGFSGGGGGFSGGGASGSW
jgi:uncharacterized protein